MYRHLVCDKNLTDVKDRGTYQRNTALAHIEEHQLDGIVYFADDDNVYTLELFEQMRNIKYQLSLLLQKLVQRQPSLVSESLHNISTVVLHQCLPCCGNL